MFCGISQDSKAGRWFAAQANLASVQTKSATSENTGGILGVAHSKGKITGHAMFVQNPEALTEWDTEDITKINDNIYLR